ncbi:TetR-like C-terminal domain-containing protein [Mycobacterium sp. 1274756.6]|uniref:TetR/AcrR family transcriptional regulator n=1 Tax=Mycobacterium sp. 1274756.6 TaxID=1834076 RepID=UPI0008016E01|nr:TetR-like C-terminal domain-containing protein [Mycobacterium sp. 1274756.6]OBJ72159.1 TetR family transcriptional regulator [Mycobacterium sp. 1274756.6]
MAATRGDHTRYHHGNLAAALVEAGLAATRTAGAAGLGIREITRRVGVTPNAAYRHFADRRALAAAVSGAIQERMADRMAGVGAAAGSSADAAVARLRAVGLGYIGFALDEPGWFSVAFFGDTDDAEAASEAGAAPPYLRLVEALDGLVAAAVLTPERRDGAEWPCFAAVHGFAELALHGPLRAAPRADLDRLAARTVDAVIAGVLDPGSADWGQQASQRKARPRP